MTYARKSLVSLQDTPYYHVLARCVRRAWLWGYDEYARKDYSHRKEWVLDRLAQLDRIFAVRVCAYAVMSNHYHLVLYVDQAQALGWDEQEVVHRWKQLFQLPTLVDRYYKNECTSSAEQKAAKVCIAMWRARLCDLSWYMRCLNEHLARLANAEDECTGRFWGVPRTRRTDPLRCCGGDEGRSLGVAVQTVTSNRPLLLRPKDVVVSEWERRRVACVG